VALKNAFEGENMTLKNAFEGSREIEKERKNKFNRDQDILQLVEEQDQNDQQSYCDRVNMTYNCEGNKRRCSTDQQDARKCFVEANIAKTTFP
jgi:hypothetical protein